MQTQIGASQFAGDAPPRTLTRTETVQSCPWPCPCLAHGLVNLGLVNLALGEEVMRKVVAGDSTMILLIKKIAGLALILLGGLMVAHGGFASVSWEVVTGTLLIVAGVAVLIMKIVSRNTPTNSLPSERAASRAK